MLGTNVMDVRRSCGKLLRAQVHGLWLWKEEWRSMLIWRRRVTRVLPIPAIRGRRRARWLYRIMNITEGELHILIGLRTNWRSLELLGTNAHRVGTLGLKIAIF